MSRKPRSATPASLASTRTRQATRPRPASRGRRARPATTPRAALQPATGSASTARRASTRAGASPCSFLAATRQIQLLSCCDALTHGRSCCLFQIRLHRWNLHVLEHVHGWAKRVLKAIGHGKQSKRSGFRPVLPLQRSMAASHPPPSFVNTPHPPIPSLLLGLHVM